MDACALWKKSIPVAQDRLVMDLELSLLAWILISNNGKWRLSLKGTCPTRNELAFTVLRLFGFPSTDFYGFCRQTGIFHARVWDEDGNRKWAIFTFNLPSHNHIHIAKYLGENTVLAREMFSSGCRPALKNARA